MIRNGSKMSSVKGKIILTQKLKPERMYWNAA